MAAKSKIEWTDATWNPIRARNRATGKNGSFCTHASEGCRFCYAETMNVWRGNGIAYKPGHVADVDIFLDEKNLLEPLHWKKPRKIFVGSMTDLFADFVADAWLDKIFAVAALCPQHVFIILTKRSARMRNYMVARPQAIWDRQALAIDAAALERLKTLQWPLPNVWLGVSCEDQANADARIPDLLATPSAVRFVSAEPLLGPIDFERLAFPKSCECKESSPTLNALDATVYCEGCCEGAERLDIASLDWIIVGGESGAQARPMHPDWARSIRDQCAACGVPFFFKQWGEWEAAVDRERDDPDWRKDYSRKFANSAKTRWINMAGGCGFHGERFHVMRRVGKAIAGRTLDGVTHDAFPLPASGERARVKGGADDGAIAP